MESKTVARVYEKLFRPAFTRLGSKASYADEERYLDAWFDPAEGPIVDLACGTGRYTRWLSARFGTDRVVGADISDSMLSQARTLAAHEGLDHLLFVRASALALPFASTSLGAIHCFGALHLFPSSDGALREVHRALRPGGCFTCLTASYANRALVHAAQSAFSRTASFRFFDVNDLTRTLERIGFELRDVTTRGMLLMFAARRR